MRVLLATTSLTLALVPSSMASPTQEKAESSREWVMCSIINLIATPERYSGRLVRTIGIATIRFEGDAVYLTEFDARHRVALNGIRLDLTGLELREVTNLHMKPVLVEGEFEGWREDVPDVFRGTIRHIRVLYSLEEEPSETPLSE